MTLGGLWRRLRFTIGRRRFDADLDDEMRLHLELRAERLRRAGVAGVEADRATRRQFGSVTLALERSRDAGTFASLGTLRQDVRYALRTLRTTPGFTLGAVLVLMLGIGANTMMFSLVNATMLRPLPLPDPDRLMTVWTTRVEDPSVFGITSLPNYRDWQARNHVFEDIALFDSAGRGYNLTSHGEPEQVPGVRVTATFFPVLGVQPMLGRTFLAEEEEPGRDRVVVLSYGLWVRRYAADAAIVGRTIRVDGEPYTVVGVMPPDFFFQFWSLPRQLWVPAGWTRGDRERNSNSFLSIARLKRGATVADARSEMDVIGRALAAEHPTTNAGLTVRVMPIAEYVRQSVRMPLFALLGVVGFVLLIACVNVANLMLARGATRGREFAVRRALGAGRRRLVAQLLMESVVLGSMGGACGLVLALLSSRLLGAMLPGDAMLVPMRSLDAIGVDTTVLLFTLGVSVMSGVLFGLAPALSACRQDVSHPMKLDARSLSGGRGRLRFGLLACEVALTLVVLAGAGVMIVSVARLLGVEPGLDPHNVLVMQMSLPQENLYYGPPAHPRFCANLDDRVGAVPGVVSVSAIAHLPLSGAGAGRAVTIEGRPDPGLKRQAGAAYSVVCPNVLRTFGIALLAGREFTERDTLEAPGVVLVNEALAKRSWPNEGAVGKRLKLGPFNSPEPWLTVVGVFRNARLNALDVDVRPTVFRPYNQAAWPTMSIVTKTATAPAAFAPMVKRALADIEPNQPVSGVRTMEEVVDHSVGGRRLSMQILTGFAVLALVLAVVGIAGVVAYSVAQRTSEIGIRIALGAQAVDVMRLVLGESISWSLLGVGAGVVASLGLLRFLRGMLYAVSPTDPTVLVAVSVLLVVVSVAASYVPARRAIQVDPVSALRRDDS